MLLLQWEIKKCKFRYPEKFCINLEPVNLVVELGNALKMMLILTNTYIFIMALVLAILEIQIEGKDGWAKNLPTWKPPLHTWYVKLYSRLMFKKRLTGYHLAMHIFVILIFYLPYADGLPFTLFNWTKTLALYFLFILVWDFLWFVLNPYYSLAKFKKQNVPWHVVWLFGLPVDYWAALVLSFIVLTPNFINNFYSSNILSWWFLNIILFGVQTFFICILSMIYPFKSRAI